MPLKDGSDISSITGLHIRRKLWLNYRSLKKKVSHAKRQAKAQLIDLTKPIRDNVLLAVKDVLKSAIADDPDMCPSTRKWVGDRVEDVWHDVVDKVEYAVQEARDGIALSKGYYMDCEELKTAGEEPPCCSLLRLRAFILYHQLPYDMSIFGNFRDPWYWVIAAPSFLPDVRLLYYGVLLMCINFPGPPDEYQLVQYILAVKAMQFLCSGVGMAFVGGLQYFMCVKQNGEHTCDTEGPGSLTSIHMGVIDIVGCCCLIWLAFLLLPYSHRSAGLRRENTLFDHLEHQESMETQHDIEHSEHEGAEEQAHHEAAEERSCCCCSWEKEAGRGGRLRGLLRYDLVCFLLYGLFALLISARHYRIGQSAEEFMNNVEKWQLQAALYWARVFYAFLAFPFFVFNLPIFSSIFTHTVPTGYNRNGAVVPYYLRPLPEGVPSAVSKKPSGEVTSNENGTLRSMSSDATESEATSSLLMRSSNTA